MKKLHAIFTRFKAPTGNSRFLGLGIQKIRQYGTKSIFPIGSLFLVLCILAMGQRLRTSIQQQNEFLEHELILSVHAFNQLQREVNRLHGQVVTAAIHSDARALKRHTNLVQSRVSIVENNFNSKGKDNAVREELSDEVEGLLADWKAIKNHIIDLQGELQNEPLQERIALELKAFELEINHVTLINQHRNRNNYRKLLNSQENSLNWLAILLFSFIAFAILFSIYFFHFLQVRQRMLEEMKQLSSTDELTQIPNRRQFNEVLSREWHRMMRDNLPLSIILCDIDYFKRYNDSYGHQAGDVCLQQVAQALQQGLRQAGDFVARYGGEEFVVILPDTSLESALDVAARLQLQVSRLDLEHLQSSVSSHITLSLGIASGMPSPAVKAEAVLECADQALYEAKELGRDRTCTRTFDTEQLRLA